VIMLHNRGVAMGNSPSPHTHFFLKQFWWNFDIYTISWKFGGFNGHSRKHPYHSHRGNRKLTPLPPSDVFSGTTQCFHNHFAVIFYFSTLNFLIWRNSNSKVY
jgi:hypothetical protein